MAQIDNSEVVRETYRAFDAKDVERALKLTTPEAKMLNVAFGASLGFRDYFNNWANAFPDGKVEIVNLVAQGEHVIVECIGRGTHTGVLRGPTGDLPPTRRKVELRFVESYDLRNGKIAGARMYFDLMGFLRQLGIGERPQPEAGAPPPVH